MDMSEDIYGFLFEKMDDGCVVIQAGIIVFANPAFCRMHHCRERDVCGRPFAGLVAPENRNHLPGLVLGHHSDLKTPVTFQYQRISATGETLYTEIRVSEAILKGVHSTIGICRDVTGRVRMDRERRDAERMSYIGQFADFLSHEIRNPLSSIKLNLQIFQKNKEIQGADRRRVEISLSDVTPA